MVDAYARTTRRDGVTLNYRTLEMFEVAEMRMRLGERLVLTQGSYSTNVEASAGTHAGGGALDVRARDLTSSQRDSVVYWLRRQGFAAWLRTPAQSADWPYHVHAIAIGDHELSRAAQLQVTAYRNGRNGLANDASDDGPRVPWSTYKQEVDLSYYGPERWDAADYKKLANQLFSQDGIVDPPDSLTTPDNPRWAVLSTLRRLLFQGIDATAAKSAAESADAKLTKVLAKLGEPDPPPF